MPARDILQKRPCTLKRNFKENSILWLTARSHVFGPKKDEVTGEWRKLHNEELRDLYSSPNIHN
jgi:hypothetical protein